MIRQAVIAELARCGWSQSELARAAGLPQPNVSAFLTGRADMTTKRVSLILQALSLTVCRTRPKTRLQPRG